MMENPGPRLPAIILTPPYPKVYDSTTATFVDSRIYLPRVEGKGEEATHAEPNARLSPKPSPATAASGTPGAPAAVENPWWPISFQDASLKMGVLLPIPRSVGAAQSPVCR